MMTGCGCRKKPLIAVTIITLSIQLTIYIKTNQDKSTVLQHLQNANSNSNYNINWETIQNGILASNNTQWFREIKSFTVVGDYNYFIYSVHGELSLQNGQWSSVVFNGWEIKKRVIPYICCLKFKNGFVFTSKSVQARPYRMIKTEKSYRSLQILCDIKNDTLPEFATLVVAENKCYQNTTHFYRPEYRQVIKEPKFAINLQLAYGNKDAGELIEFMEYHLHYGASPITIYQMQSLNKNARKVFEYYVRNGDLEVIDYPKFHLDRYHRRSKKLKPSMIINREVVRFDAQQRLRYYKYFVIMDTDEYIVPGKNITNFLQLMEDLVGRYSNASSFQMLTEVHLKNWMPTNNESRLMIGRYGYHTEPTYLANKYIFLPNRVVPGSVWQHGAIPNKGYKSIELRPEEAVLKHFRLCNNNWVTNVNKPCMALFQKLRGHLMDNIVDKLSEKVLEVKQRLGIL